jgi:Spy/CpxP family protein refolding chaperone
MAPLVHPNQQNQHTMKTLKGSLRSLLLAGTVVVVPFAMAQDRSGEHARKAGNPEARVERMTKDLGLDAEQAAKIKALTARNVERMAAINTIEDEELRRQEIRENQKAFREAVQRVLTPEQRIKAEALRTERNALRGDGKEGWNADPEKRAEARTEWMTKELGLSADQAAKVKAIHLQHMKKYAEIKAIQDEAQRKTAMAEVRKSQTAALQAVLTPDQQKRMQELKAERKAKHELRKAEGDRKG